MNLEPTPCITPIQLGVFKCNDGPIWSPRVGYTYLFTVVLEASWTSASHQAYQNCVKVALVHLHLHFRDVLDTYAIVLAFCHRMVTTRHGSHFGTTSVFVLFFFCLLACCQFGTITHVIETIWSQFVVVIRIRCLIENLTSSSLDQTPIPSQYQQPRVPLSSFCNPEKEILPLPDLDVVLEFVNKVFDHEPVRNLSSINTPFELWKLKLSSWTLVWKRLPASEEDSLFELSTLECEEGRNTCTHLS